MYLITASVMIYLPRYARAPESPFPIPESLFPPESKALRERVLPLGVSQISGASKTSVGGYCTPEPEDEKSEQFDVSDRRTSDEVVKWLMEWVYSQLLHSLLPEGRTGDRFMSLCKSKQIKTAAIPTLL